MTALKDQLVQQAELFTPDKISHADRLDITDSLRRASEYNDPIPPWFKFDNANSTDQARADVINNRLLDHVKRSGSYHIGKVVHRAPTEDDTDSGTTVLSLGWYTANKNYPNMTEDEYRRNGGSDPEGVITIVDGTPLATLRVVAHEAAHAYGVISAWDDAPSWFDMIFGPEPDSMSYENAADLAGVLVSYNLFPNHLRSWQRSHEWHRQVIRQKTEIDSTSDYWDLVIDSAADLIKTGEKIDTA